MVLPTGTQVVTRVAAERFAGGEPRPRGAVGVVIAAPVEGGALYRVRFPDGAEADLPREALTIRKHF